MRICLPPRKLVPEGLGYRRCNAYTEVQLINLLSNRIIALPHNRLGVKVALFAGAVAVGKSTLAKKIASAVGSARLIDLDRWGGPFTKVDPTVDEYYKFLGLEKAANDFMELIDKGQLRLPKRIRRTKVEDPSQSHIKELEEVPFFLSGISNLLIAGYLSFLLEPVFDELSPLKIYLVAERKVRAASRIKRGIPRVGVRKPQGIIKRMFQQERCADIIIEVKVKGGNYSYIVWEK